MIVISPLIICLSALASSASSLMGADLELGESGDGNADNLSAVTRVLSRLFSIDDEVGLSLSISSIFISSRASSTAAGVVFRVSSAMTIKSDVSGSKSKGLKEALRGHLRVKTGGSYRTQLHMIKYRRIANSICRGVCCAAWSSATTGSVRQARH